MTAAITLTGCTAGTPEPTPTVGGEIAVEPTPEPVVEVAVPAVGATGVSVEEADAARAAGLGVYTMADGTLTVVDPAGTLPDAVIADIDTSTGVRSASAVPSTIDVNKRDPSDKRQEVGERVFEETGKTVVYVVAGGQYGLDRNLEKVIFSYGALSDGELILFEGEFPDADETLAAAQAAVAAEADPGRYVIVDLTR